MTTVAPTPADAATGHPALALPFSDITLDALPQVGGKNASLGELTRVLAAEGAVVPDGFALTARAFRLHLEANGLDDVWDDLDRLDVTDVAALARIGGEIRARVAAAPLPRPVADVLAESYAALAQRAGEPAIEVAVRSSATAEDLPSASFAGQHESFLNVRGLAALDRAVRACFASLFTDRAIVYRTEHGFRHRDVALAVGVQRMVRSDLGSAGVVFTLDPESGFRDVVLVTAAWGLGETVVLGRVQPDEYWIHKPTLLAGHRAVIRRQPGDKAVKRVYAEGTEGSTRELPVPAADRRRFVLAENDVLQLARWAVVIERHYSARAGAPMPMDIEWARDGRNGRLCIVQARPETVHAQAEPGATLWSYVRRGEGEVLVRGRSVGFGVESGIVRVVRSPADLPAFRHGEVLVARMTDPDWEPVLARAAAVVTDEGGRTCHAAIVSRELGVPCVVGTGRATEVLESGTPVTVSCADGDEGVVYAGRVPFDKVALDLSALPKTRVPLQLNVGNPERAFRLAAYPVDGVGLARIEFVVSNWIGIHPMALLHTETLDAAVADEIRRRIEPWESGAEFFVERLASGVAQIAAAFWPRPVLVRFSDFKSNEYAGLFGGRAFEPAEPNPMIGFRGASRYYDPRYAEAFALECAAIRRVREVMGLTNVRVMIPFCRTLEEGRLVLAEMAKHGLERGRDGLEVWVMCEIPNNVVLAAGFAELFDGFSIGSNDLTQLVLGVDRDSKELAGLFDERDPGVKKMIAQVVATAHAAGRPVGLCGQAPSDDPEYARWLADIGIDSISLVPDAVGKVADVLGSKAETRL